MEKDFNERIDYQNSDNPQDMIMNRVNRTFDKMTKDVKDLIVENRQKNNNR